ncbi:MAG: DUF3990 domain-containing protein [Muribaculaceae bacterium]|nr:DUF3990 domain-containing protein [Muribaculaceae bacterium]
MILYHGTNIDFDEIDLGRSNPFKDFGKGFYLTDIRTQAEELARKRMIRDGGSQIVQVYGFDEALLADPSLKSKKFDGPTAEWAEFIYRNRNRSESVFKHDYDIVIGPIADDGVAYLLSRYQEGSFTIEELADQLKYKRLNSQYYFGTARAISLLKRIK